MERNKGKRKKEKKRQNKRKVKTGLEFEKGEDGNNAMEK